MYNITFQLKKNFRQNLKKMDALYKRFTDEYQKFFSPEQQHLMIQILLDPNLQKFFQKNKFPTKKAIQTAMSVRGIEILTDDEDDRINLPQSSVSHSSSKKNLLGIVMNRLIKIEDIVMSIQNMVSQNIDFATGSSEIYSNAILSPEDRRLYVEKVRQSNELTSCFSKAYNNWLSEFKNRDLIEGMIPLLTTAIALIDRIVGNSKMSQLNQTSGQPFLNPVETIVVFNREEFEHSNGGSNYTSPETLRKILALQDQSTKYSQEKDPIIFTSLSDQINQGGVLTRIISFAFYIDYITLFKRFITTHPEDCELSELYIDAIDIASSSGNSQFFTNPNFPRFFLTMAEDAYTHFMCCVKFKTSHPDHGGVFWDVHKSLFV